MHYNNIYNFIKTTLDSPCMGNSSSSRYGIDPGISAPEKRLPDFKPPEGYAFAIKILNQSNQIVLEKNFNNEKEFQTFCDKCTHIESVGFFSTSFKTARINSITDFTKTFFFPTTTMYPITPAAYLLTIIWDLGTLFCRLLTLPYRFYEYHHTPQHPLLEELKKADLVKNTKEPYLDVHFRAKKWEGRKKADIRLGERIFFERHTQQERSRYCERENSSSFDESYFNFDGYSSDSPPAPKASSKAPNPKTQADIHNRGATPTIDEALAFFGLSPNFTQQQLDSQFRKKSLRFHPDKIKDNGFFAKWASNCREVLRQRNSCESC